MALSTSFLAALVVALIAVPSESWIGPCPTRPAIQGLVLQGWL